MKFWAVSPAHGTLVNDPGLHKKCCSSGWPRKSDVPSCFKELLNTDKWLGRKMDGEAGP